MSGHPACPSATTCLIGDDLAVGAPFRVGVNYWPRRKAMGWWKDFDRGEVADEFDVVADLGMSLVRIFLLWEDFQPQPTTVSRAALADLEIRLRHGRGPRPWAST